MKERIFTAIYWLCVVVLWVVLIFVYLPVMTASNIVWLLKGLLYFYIVAWIVSMLVALLFFAAWWSCIEEYEAAEKGKKEPIASFFRGIIISLATWLIVGLVMLFGLFDKDKRHLFLGKSVSG